MCGYASDREQSTLLFLWRLFTAPRGPPDPRLPGSFSFFQPTKDHRYSNVLCSLSHGNHVAGNRTWEIGQVLLLGS